jgi:transcriptional regulator with XRE-family HTH domain
LSQEKFGFETGLHRNYVSGAELGQRNVSFEALEKWLRGAGATWTEFG